jgi:hypothetical protein
MTRSLPPPGSIYIKKVDENDNFIEDTLEADDIPINTSGSPYEDLGISGTNIQDAFEDL